MYIYTIHLHVTNLTTSKYQKEIYYRGINIFNYLPNHIKNVTNEILVLAA
jgi:hypothetical protein